MNIINFFFFIFFKNKSKNTRFMNEVFKIFIEINK